MEEYISLRQLREVKGLTQTELAAALNVGNRTVSLIETGQRSPSFKIKQRLNDLGWKVWGVNHQAGT